MHFELKTLLNTYTVVTMPGFNNYYFQRNKPLEIKGQIEGLIFRRGLYGGKFALQN